MKVLVTGGGGFLGSAIVRLLLERGHAVRSFSRGDYSHLRAAGVEVERGDVAERAALERAVRGCDAVIHTAARAGVWGREEDYRRTNVQGTTNVIAACRAAGIGRLVHTSSPSVVYSGRDENGIDETAPYPDRYLAAYPRTKALAEQAVLAANGPDLATVALRPHLLLGPGDPHLAPRVLERARAGRLALVGSGENRVDATWIDNAARAHLLALERLAPDSACAGKAYFISNGEPLSMAALLNHILAAAGLPPVRRHIPPQLAYAAGAVLETVYRSLNLPGEPIMTRFVARQLATSHWFRLDRARRDLGYEPSISLEDAFNQLRAHLSAPGGGRAAL